MGDSPSSSSSSSSSASLYIRMVQHLIEKCLLFHMSKDECVEALSEHASINPVITATVWGELEKENKEFFEAYSKNREESVVEMRSRMQTMLITHQLLPPPANSTSTTTTTTTTSSTPQARNN